MFDAPWVALMPGELGVIWTSVKGGGLGRRGVLEGDAGLIFTVERILPNRWSGRRRLVRLRSGKETNSRVERSEWYWYLTYDQF